MFPSSCVVETGLSDFHRMTVTVMKTTFKKFKPRIIHDRDYTNFQNDQYRDELTPKLSNIVSKNNNIRLNELFAWIHWIGMHLASRSKRAVITCHL